MNTTIKYFLDKFSTDVLIIADGSGNLVNQHSGWAALLYINKTSKVYQICGGASVGTNQVAELQPFLTALWYAGRLMNGWGAGDRVTCVTDSQVTVCCGNKEYERNANSALWAQLEWYEKHGVLFKWIWVPRNSNPINKWADKQAEQARLALKELEYLCI